MLLLPEALADLSAASSAIAVALTPSAAVALVVSSAIAVALTPSAAVALFSHLS